MNTPHWELSIGVSAVTPWFLIAGHEEKGHEEKGHEEKGHEEKGH